LLETTGTEVSRGGFIQAGPDISTVMASITRSAGQKILTSIFHVTFFQRQRQTSVSESASYNIRDFNAEIITFFV